MGEELKVGEKRKRPGQLDKEELLMASVPDTKRVKMDATSANEEKKVSKNFNHEYIFVQEDPKQNVNPENQAKPIE